MLIARSNSSEKVLVWGRSFVKNYIHFRAPMTALRSWFMASWSVARIPPKLSLAVLAALSRSGSCFYLVIAEIRTPLGHPYPASISWDLVELFTQVQNIPCSLLCTSQGCSLCQERLKPLARWWAEARLALVGGGSFSSGSMSYFRVWLTCSFLCMCSLAHW